MNEYLVISNLKEAGFVFNAGALDKGRNWPKEYDCRFIEPGLINYDDMGAGTALVRKEALDKMANSFKGRPVLFKRHDNVSPETFEEKACGLVNEVYFNASDGWFHAKFFVWDDATKSGIESGKFSVSCAYVPSDTDINGGIYNNINYDMEVKNGEYTHLAIVENPRYNGAKIFVNSKGGGKAMKEKVKKILTELSNTLNDMFGKGEEELKNAEISTVVGAKLDTIISLLNELKEDDDEEKKKKLEAKNASDEEEKKKKEDEEKKNASEAEEKKKKEDEEKANALKAVEIEKQNAIRNAEDAKKHFTDLKNKADERGGKGEVILNTKEDRRAEGKKKYGSENIEGGK